MRAAVSGSGPPAAARPSPVWAGAVGRTAPSTLRHRRSTRIGTYALTAARLKESYASQTVASTTTDATEG
ncbi:hypothetical protein OG985_48925 (plasmid) [Streptomyces sp. NBC_00289]